MKRALALLLPAAAAGCAAPGSYPSLAPRAAEALYAAGDPLAPPPVYPDRPQVAETAAALAAEGRGGDLAFQDALAAAQPLAARAGAYGGETWVAAQQALSRAEAARAPTLRALADLDAFALRAAAEAPLSTADRARLTEAIAALQLIADAQQDRLDALRAALAR